jgi:MFS transporter, PAT family, beta-lactamase induction signal transducer AmpG
MSETAAEAPKQAPRFVRAMRALGDRRMLAMLLMSFAAGLPNGAVLGTLNAWLTEANVSPSDIGVLSFIILAYSFKFFWSPLFLQPRSPVPGGLGPRRNWLIGFQFLIGALLFLLSQTDPARSVALVAFVALGVALASATHDIVLDAWRIEVARSDEDKDLMSALYQFGYRLSTLLTGAVALMMAEALSWPIIYMMFAGAMLLTMLGTFIAPEPEHAPPRPLGELARESRVPALLRRAVTGGLALGWLIAVGMILAFMVQRLSFTSSMLPDGSQTQPPDPRVFTREQGPVIVSLFIILPTLAAAGLIAWLRRRDGGTLAAGSDTSGLWGRTADALFASVLVPLMDFVRRFGWGLLLIFALVLTYRFADLVWGSFAFPFYLGLDYGALGRDYSEIAFASKTFGVIMTVSGSAIGALVLVFLGRMPTLVLGALVAAATNLLFADLAAGRFDAALGLKETTDPSAGAAAVIGFLEATGLRGLFEAIIGVFSPLFGLDTSDGLVALTAAIAAENLAVGFASVAGVAYLTSIANPKYAAVQYALLASLTMLIGSLGRGWLGALIESNGFYDVFILTFWIGMVPVVLAGLEWLRQWRMGHPSETLAHDRDEVSRAKG